MGNSTTGLLFFWGGGFQGENKSEMPSQGLTMQCTVNITRKGPALVRARLRPPLKHRHHHHKCLQIEFTKKTLLSLSMAHSISIFVNYIHKYIQGVGG